MIGGLFFCANGLILNITMAINQFSLIQGISEDLEMFPQIAEFSLRKITAIELGSFEFIREDNFQIWFVMGGKFDWTINGENFVLYPGSAVVILPGHVYGGTKGYMDLGTLICLKLQIDDFGIGERLAISSIGQFSEIESQSLEGALKENYVPTLAAKEIGIKLMELFEEISNKDIGFVTRVNHLIDSILILIVRKLYHEKSCNLELYHVFQSLDKSLNENLAHHWSVEEMAESVGLGTTSFTEKLKSYSGYTPINYLIKMRVSEAIRLLQEEDSNITDIAIKTGFYSSQHFSTTFKKMTGHSPRQFMQLNVFKNTISTSKN